MAELTAKFSLIDDISSQLATIADSGQKMVYAFEQAGASASEAIDGISRSSVTTASSIDGVAHSMDEVVGQTDHWTAAVGNYDKSALEAIYSTEELVEAGYKSAAALEEQEQMYALCEQAAGNLSMSLEAATEIQNEYAKVQEQAASAMEELANNENVRQR